MLFITFAHVKVSQSKRSQEREKAQLLDNKGGGIAPDAKEAECMQS